MFDKHCLQERFKICNYKVREYSEEVKQILPYVVIITIIIIIIIIIIIRYGCLLSQAFSSWHFS